MLALLLSAVGGIRVGFDRMVCGNGDYRPAAICAATPREVPRDVVTPVGVACATMVSSIPVTWPAAALALCGLRSAGDHLPAPSLLLGCAGGPRAP